MAKGKDEDKPEKSGGKSGKSSTSGQDNPGRELGKALRKHAEEDPINQMRRKNR